MNTSTYWCAVDLENCFILFRSLKSLIFARLEMAAGKYQESYSSRFPNCKYQVFFVKISTILMLPSVRRLGINIVTKLLALFVKGESVSMHISPYSIFLCCIYKQRIMNVIVKQKQIYISARIRLLLLY
ncbi:hypothetical protein NC653_018064 [Populus alba x Populus x berolinensis]|uniref:Uncharacterized protein n=1 Tax=Populus alba x Populus x berolinensis TaxID=444605 RepID=A0AAD6W1A7_9ROSI|nr:hypothetical protein NC653_018064 [Populus alba x Populus x berolinensis]